ncbi:Leishmanolysin [Novymonas esmeraldas]|uniref:Leishmanolysin-like peptidase n=1 Tax=Novymonas esmeraldas TaxID=1808958 RepID=A0AAW0EMM1_9TRYP
MKDDLMAGITVAGIYSAITIAAMEDTGFYKGNYAMAEPMMYGRNAGCGLALNECVVNGVSQIPEMFCTFTEKKLVCTSDRLGLGACLPYNQPSQLPPAVSVLRQQLVRQPQCADGLLPLRAAVSQYEVQYRRGSLERQCVRRHVEVSGRSHWLCRGLVVVPPVWHLRRGAVFHNDVRREGEWGENVHQVHTR